jgi:hypothetical protein
VAAGRSPAQPAATAVTRCDGPLAESEVRRRLTANSLHIMPWSAVEKFFSGVDGVLEPLAMLAVYGPFNYHGAFTSDSNREFDGWLKQRSALSGIRDFEAVDALAKEIGLELVKDHAMPANNRLIIWQR